MGAIGTLANSGTISGPVAIDNTSAGTLGPITNSGLIAGNIVNAAARDLTINGASGTGLGTLTGSGGAITSAGEGTITNTSSNAVFSSGNLLLNDAINVGSFSVITSGGFGEQEGSVGTARHDDENISGHVPLSDPAVTPRPAGLVPRRDRRSVRGGGPTRRR